MDDQKAASPIFYARFAGFLYLLIIILGISAEFFIRAKLIVAEDPAATAENILNFSTLFRMGFLADALMVMADAALSLFLFILFEPVHKKLSMAAAVFRLIQAAILGFNLLNYHAAILTLTSPAFTSPLTAEQVNALTMLFLDLHSHGYDLGLIFFGVSNLILGCLILKADIPKLLGYGLAAAGLVYLFGSSVRFMHPSLYPQIEAIYIIPLIAELSFCLWLLLGRKSSFENM
ncbi:protein of unknown function [Desulfatibacillum alkenivorans DSM 16219]|jgi:hypothetical protein|uniref:DUF4386 domain-containing protein n=1 Tax=Desulfatibacillum alkenivorans DSM 16219 TaxID=1121393 RepID=A0A1M6BV35_9BACT|nr:DUF4386 domain-containing protein [Desulfatibacillum alkenivorans]SHI52473.1 protein of unknown function [Desulfatibacillum alkenivorans DSM 16219]